MRAMNRRNGLIYLCSGLILLCGCGTATEGMIEPEFVLTYAENQAVDYPSTQAGQVFADLVEERTDGKIKIQVIANGALGDQDQVISQIQFGGIDLARVSISSLSDEIPSLNILQLPFLYEDSEHMWAVLNGQIGKDFLEAFGELNLVGLSWYDAGARSFYSSKNPIESPADLQGMTVRVQDSDMMKDMVSLLGGQPVTFAYSDVYSAFETGQIDAAENNWPAYQSSKHYEVAKYYTVDEHTRVPEVQLISGVTWEKLSEEYQQILLECAKESSEYEQKIWEEQEKTSRKIAKEQGCQEIFLSNEELQKMREIATPVYEKYCAEYMELIEEIKASYEVKNEKLREY